MMRIKEGYPAPAKPPAKSYKPIYVAPPVPIKGKHNVVESLSQSIKHFFAPDLNNTKNQGEEMKEETIYSYVIVRTDLPKIHQAVQAGHAAQEAGKRFGPTPNQNHLIYLQVPNKTELFKAMEYLMMNDIKVEPWTEPDYNRGLTAIATEYITSRTKREVLKPYEMLWQEDQQLEEVS
jgi:hypothetical protein